MNTKHLFFIVLLSALTGCHKVSVGFSYSPTDPKTGEKVTFTNESENGEDYTWDFGDNHTVETKSASHTYSKAGTYVVTLQEKRTKKTCQHAVTVTDSVAGISLSSDSICRFDNVSLKAQVWNPFSHEVTYRWRLDEDTRLIAGSPDGDSIVVQFRHTADLQNHTATAQIGLDVTMDGTVYSAEQTVTVYERQTWSLLLRTADGDWFQPVYLPYYDIVRRLDDANGSVSYTTAEGHALLDGHSPTLSATDRMEKKRYTGGSNGLYVSHLNGSAEVQLTTDSIGTMVLDSIHQRLFYSTGEGVFAMPLVYSPNNQSREEAVRVNELTGIQAMTTKE